MASERVSRIPASEGSATASLPPMPAMFMPPKLDIIQLVADARGSRPPRTACSRSPASAEWRVVSLRSRLRTVFLLGVLELGAISGVPMPPENIRALMDSINRQKLAHTLPSEQQSGDEPAK
jgi:hypothetical protein